MAPPGAVAVNLSETSAVASSAAVNRDRPLALDRQPPLSRAAVARRWAPVLTILGALALTAWSLFPSSAPRPPRKRPPVTAPVTREPVQRAIPTPDAKLIS